MRRINILGFTILFTTFVFGGLYLITGDYWFDRFHLGEKGSLGDAVNGLTAPFIGFFSALLIFISFREQIAANKLLQAQWQHDNNLRQFEKLKELLSTIPALQHIPNPVRDDDDSIPDTKSNFFLLHDSGVFKSIKSLTNMINEFNDYLYLIGDKDNLHRDYFLDKVYDHYNRNLHGTFEVEKTKLKGVAKYPHSELYRKIVQLQKDIAKIDSYLVYRHTTIIEKRERKSKRPLILKLLFFNENQNLFDNINKTNT